MCDVSYCFWLTKLGLYYIQKNKTTVSALLLSHYSTTTFELAKYPLLKFEWYFIAHLPACFVLINVVGPLLL